jgi:hypothetical protein
MSRRPCNWLKIKNPAAPAVKREAEEEWETRRARGSVEIASAAAAVDLVRLPWRHAPLCAPATLGHTRDDGATNRIGIAELTDTAGVTGPALSPNISARSRGRYTNQA